MSRGSSAFEAIRQARLLRQQLIDQRPLGFLQRVAALPAASSKTRSARRQSIVDPAPRRPRGRDRLRREIGNVAVAGEREMHFGDAPPGLRHVAQIGDLLLALAGMLARRQQALLVDEAVEIGRGHGPGVALVRDEGVHDADRAAARRPRPVRRCRAAPACWRSRRRRSGSGRSRSRD